MDKQFILKTTARMDDGKRRTSQQLVTGKPEEVRAAAKKLHKRPRRNLAGYCHRVQWGDQGVRGWD